ncbi:cocaine- and amphetamine-regulated transcript protein-like [Acipenser oxyrinchus oxyrinchus]|uniref:Cocaine- and amphetamine-regulated transcript protein n=1 Tax=Acipenser oxyrinchus oxyrinchus TaxID=40147 RepID=A0AAD8CEY5_ACIOX|nr:cocaine- and amphetamine-regulated transcript protein-like [Acipenser oxyrinchus oxyrinchus]
MSAQYIKWRSGRVFHRILRSTETLFERSWLQVNSATSFSTMVSSRLLLLCITCSVLFVLVYCEEAVEVRSIDNSNKSQEEKELIEALQEVLEKLKSKRLPSAEKKLGWVPSCDAGEQCAVRKGSRIGKLCNCPRGTSCNFYILKCL